MKPFVNWDMVQQEHSRRKARLHAIADESVNLQNRIIRSRERLKRTGNTRRAN